MERAYDRRRILVVDDNADAAQTLAMVLAAMGYESYFLTESREVLQKVETLRPDLVFLDIGMPLMNGWDVARQLRRRFGTEGMRLVALTAHGDEKDRVKSRQAGLDAHIVKPASAELIESTLRTLFPDSPASSS